MALGAPFPILYCDDLPRSLAFYRDLLGFTESFRFPPDSDNPGFVALELDGRELGLGRADAPAYHGKSLRPATGHGFELCLVSDDVDADVERLRAAGVPVLREPADQAWGERLAYVEDPDGNPVHINSVLASA